MSKNKVTITINGQNYNIVGTESQEYMQKVARYIDQKITELMLRNSQLTMQMASVLASINVADDYFKSVEAADNLRMQTAQYIDDASKLRNENSDLKSQNERLSDEIRRLQNEVERLKGRNL